MAIKAFSLVELMVVIAIVALLAGVAMPVYKSYVAKARMSEVYTIVDRIKTDMVDFYTTNGYFPSSADLGYATSGGTQNITTPTDINQYFITAAIQNHTHGYSQFCTKTGRIWINLNGTAMGIDNPNNEGGLPATWYQFWLGVFDINGVIYTICGTNGGGPAEYVQSCLSDTYSTSAEDADGAWTAACS